MLYPYFQGGVLSARQQGILEALARQRRVSKSEVVRQLLEEQAPQVGLVATADHQEDEHDGEEAA
jgi:putative heme iron utilization protein